MIDHVCLPVRNLAASRSFYEKAFAPLGYSYAFGEEVQAFYAAALKAGARDNGAPGPRPQYTADYYAAFVLDPDGHNIEAMLE